MARDMLLEIGMEEIPARFMPATIAAMKESAERMLAENRIQYTSMNVYGTPRRLVLIARELNEAQEDTIIEIPGPPAKVAFTEEGIPTKAALGFARNQGVDVIALKIRDTEKGEYVYAERHEEGKLTRDILPAILQRLLSSISFPKSMCWNNTRIRFARPVRWLLAFLGDEPLTVRFAGIESGTHSCGHHFMSHGTFSVKGIDEYMGLLEKNYVILDHVERRRLIEEQVQEISREKGGRVIGDGGLLDEITFLTEYPVVICGGFDERYLTIPREVLITVMREHQRCFSLEGERGEILPFFVAVSNTAPVKPDVVCSGYERVIRARLSDARFFLDADCKRNLDTHSERLKQVVFMGKLGTMLDKVGRLMELSGRLCPFTGGAGGTVSVKRAAQLSKADLVTDMVGEFPELQGVMGREYAIRQGEEQGVADAISEHYLPRFSGDAVPSTPAGKALAIADRIDNIVGCFGTGNIPSGSYDPYALRRQALGILSILIAGKDSVSLANLIEMALSAYGEMIPEAGHKGITEGVMDFFKERLNAFLVSEGYRYDCVRGVLSPGLDDPFDAFLRIRAMDRFRLRPEFESLIISFKRVMNIIPPDFKGETRVDLLRESEERRLFDSYNDIAGKTVAAMEERKYEDAFSCIAGLKPHIDLFFDKVLVMDKDMALRNNRLSILNSLKELFLSLVDFTQIVVEG